jgi:serine/threonine protein phosphatase PrpC
MAELRWGAFTDPGRVREANEDTYVAEPLVFVVADGMGGHQAGEVASALAASTLRERLMAGAPSVDVVVAAVLEANAAIFQTAHNNAEQRGMGTTLAALTVLHATDQHPEQLALVNVGDSRVYLLRSGEMTRATVDHSYVQELLATGHITEAEARNHPRRNIVTRALGIEPTVRVDSWLLPIVRGDRFVLCSDGLVDEVDDFDIHTILDDNPDPATAAQALAAAAVANGGRDNVTVIVVDVIDGVDPAAVEALQADMDATVQLARQPSQIASDPITDRVPVIAAATEAEPTAKRTLNAGTFVAFLLAAVVLTVVITLIAVAVSNSGDDPAPTSTTSSTTSTSSTTTSSTSTTSTTIRPSSTSSDLTAVGSNASVP